MINLDFSSVPSREPLEEGLYIVTIEKAEEKTSSTGNPMIALTYNVEEVEGQRKLFDNYSLQEKALFKLQSLMKALGYDTSEIVSLDVSDLVGQQLRAKVIQEEYNGDTVNRVTRVYPVA